jgi:hypothetical protein
VTLFNGVPRRRRGAQAELTDEQRMALASGHWEDAFASEDEARSAWFAFRASFMATNPGTRPSGWWSFESPIPRPQYLSQAPVLFDAPDLLEPAERAELAAWYARSEVPIAAQAKSARDYHTRCRRAGLPMKARRRWPGETAEDLAAGQLVDKDPRLMTFEN